MFASRVLPGMITCLLALVLVGCRTSAAPSGTATDSFDVVTFNLYHDRAAWPPRKPLVVEALRQLDPDVIVLQEVLQHDTLPNQAEDLAQALGYQAYFISIDPPGKVRRYGNAILTRAPVLARGWVPLRPLQDSRSAGWVRIEHAGTPVTVYATHLHHQDDDAGRAMRREQLDDLLALVSRTSAGTPSIIAGDFNSAAGNPELSVLQPQFVEAFTALHPDDTHPTLNPFYFKDDHRRIDHVYVQQAAWTPLEARIVLDREGAPGVWPSDHFGVFVRLQHTR